MKTQDNENKPSSKQTNDASAGRPPLELDEIEKAFLVGMMSGRRPEPDDLLDGWEEMEREKDAEAERAEKRNVIPFPGPTRKSTPSDSADPGSTPGGSTK